jgi:indole-3-glycerol phosphate synthase
MSILSEILATKRTDVSHQREKVPLHLLQEKLIDVQPTRDFKAALTANNDGAALIAEIKKASPSKGVIRQDFDPLAIARIYIENGANCISVLTDEPYFQGHLDYLREIRQFAPTPLLRKDFIIDPWQVAESRIAGADALLLIVAALCPQDLRQLIAMTREYGMAALVEVHDSDELQEALDAGADLIGINNRDLHTFRVSLSVTLDLLHKIPAERGVTVVSESGIFTRADVEMLASHGVHAVLVGEALMREADIGAKVRALTGK